MFIVLLNNVTYEKRATSTSARDAVFVPSGPRPPHCAYMPYMQSVSDI
jgi:hypothetical protein